MHNFPNNKRLSYKGSLLLLFSQASGSGFALDYPHQYNITIAEDGTYTVSQDGFIYARVKVSDSEDKYTPVLLINNAKPIMLSVDSDTRSGSGNHYSSRTTYWYAVYAFVKKGDIIKNFTYGDRGRQTFTFIPLRK